MLDIKTMGLFDIIDTVEWFNSYYGKAITIAECYDTIFIQIKRRIKNHNKFSFYRNITITNYEEAFYDSLYFEYEHHYEYFKKLTIPTKIKLIKDLINYNEKDENKYMCKIKFTKEFEEFLNSDFWLKLKLKGEV